MALFCKLWHYLVIQVALDILGHPWSLVFQAVLGYLVNPSPLGVHKVLKGKKTKQLLQNGSKCTGSRAPSNKT